MLLANELLRLVNCTIRFTTNEAEYEGVLESVCPHANTISVGRVILLPESSLRMGILKFSLSELSNIRIINRPNDVEEKSTYKNVVPVYPNTDVETLVNINKGSDIEYGVDDQQVSHLSKFVPGEFEVIDSFNKDSSSATKHMRQQNSKKAEDYGKLSKIDSRKRTHHNLLEKKRRDTIKDSFCQLRDVLPYFTKKKKVRASRVQILKKSCDYIRQQRSIAEFKKEIESLEEENRLLEEKLAELDTNPDVATIKYSTFNLPLKRRQNLIEEDKENDLEDGENSDESGSPSASTASPRRKRKRI